MTRPLTPWALVALLCGCAQGRIGEPSRSSHTETADAGSRAEPGCGRAGEPCCADGSCDDGLTCFVGGCERARECGGPEQPCCSGERCQTGLTCEANRCRPSPDATVGEPGPDGGSDAYDAGPAEPRDGGAGPGPGPSSEDGGTGGTDPCSGASSCADCTLREQCGWCSGSGCRQGDAYGPASGSCAEDWCWYPIECLL